MCLVLDKLEPQKSIDTELICFSIKSIVSMGHYKMGIFVQKYGGSSLATPELIKAVAQRIVERKRRGDKLVIVVSAMGDTTDELISLAQRITSNPPKRELDMLLTVGERISASLLSMAINSLGEEAISFTGSQTGIITDERHTEARILEVRPERVKEELARGKIVIVAGFQGVSTEREITTLGRGGSDTTAVALALALGTKDCEIYTDVDGVFTADPRIVPEAHKLDEILYEEMLELSSMGAGVLHPRSVEMAAKNDIVLHVCSSFNQKKGTIVKRGTVEKPVLRGITFDKQIAMLALKDVPRSPESLSQIVTQMAEEGIHVKLFCHGAAREETVDLIFIVEETDFEGALKILRKASRNLGAKRLLTGMDVGSVSIVGLGIGRDTEILAKMFKILAGLRLHIQAVSTSESKITCVIKKKAVEEAVRTLHREFGL